MVGKDITSMRSTMEYLKRANELLTVSEEVDPIYEISGIQKALEDGPALLFENVKGYPGVRTLGNVFSSDERVAALFDVPELKQGKFKFLELMKNPLPPKVVEKAPCQEVVITKGIDAMATIPMIKHTEDDAGRILGSGIIPTLGISPGGGSDLTFKRMFFRGKDWASLNMWVASHLAYFRDYDHRGEEIPITISINPPPAVVMLAAPMTIHMIMPYGTTDEVGIAGALQGSPIEICKAKTVDAYAIANSEWVIEGLLLPQRIWETEEAERIGRLRAAPFFPEWPGYMGKAIRANKFQVTAITHRHDPIFYSFLADSFELENASNWVREACYHELAQRISPGLVIDVNIPRAFKHSGGVVFQVRKRRPSDEGVQRSILETALGASHVRMAIAVDEDIDIYSPDDLLWAIWTRANPDTDMFKGPRGARGLGMVPAQELSPDGEFEGGLGIDATIPWAGKAQSKRAHHPVDRIDLRKWFSKEGIDAVQAKQSDYARLLARIGG
jgi:4-hydroxy-3-polyprenylbenzoate decarboxylase